MLSAWRLFLASRGTRASLRALFANAAVPVGQPVSMQPQVVIVDQPIISGFGNQ